MTAEIELRGAYQDGPDFYVGGKIAASFPSLVKGDYDMPGAVEARRRFALAFPEFVAKTADDRYDPFTDWKPC